MNADAHTTLARVLAATAIAGAVLAMAAGARGAEDSAPAAAASPLVDVRTRVPDLDLDIRYAGPDNFVGTPIDGYEAPVCLLEPPVADALARVEATLRQEGFRLRVFDCYRPLRAVAHFMRWARDPAAVATRDVYFPRVAKDALVPDYIADVSGHSRGDTVDLTLLDCRDPAAGCVALEMGTPFDFFDPRAHTESPEVDAAVRERRLRLRAAMAAEGFANYPLEWWHYSRRPAGDDETRYDVPVR